MVNVGWRTSVRVGYSGDWTMRRILALLAVAMTAAALSSAPSAQTEGEGFDIEGMYAKIQPGRPLEESDQVEVVDVFWYGCPHCFQFLPYMQRWEESKPDYVAVRRVPAIFRESWIPHARAFYTARLLGVDDALHVALFNAIHGERRTLDSKEELSAFFAEHGVSAEEFNEIYDSFAVDQLQRQSQEMVRRWGVQGTPSLVINGRYLVSGSTAGSFENVIKVLDALVERERTAMAERAQ
jgi:thiol:disulfide interchange protein DsbA